MDFREEQQEAQYRKKRVRESLDSNARNPLHLSCHAVEMISLAASAAADLCFTCPLSPCRNIHQCEPGVPGPKKAPHVEKLPGGQHSNRPSSPAASLAEKRADLPEMHCGRNGGFVR